jgi:hypothetical protein
MLNPEIIKKVLNEIRKRAVNYEYFFDQLKSPEWIEPLGNEGMFRDPPPPERKENYISFPFWPESRYLVRMASKSPERVLEVILNIPETENVRVHEDLAEAACAMPPELAARWIKKDINWIKSQPHLYFLPKTYGKLISHLARGGQVDDALNLARTLLTVLPATEEDVEGENDLIPSEPRIRFDVWYYEQILKKHIPDLVMTASEDALMLLCDLLVDVIRFTEGVKENEVAEDYSYIWRPAIEDHDQNHIHGLNDLLVTAVRNAADALIETKGKIIIEFVEKQSFKVFHRIGLYLRRKWPTVDPYGTANLIVNPNVFDDIHLHHEFFHLLKEQFNKLPHKTKEVYLKLIAYYCNLNEWSDFEEREYGHRPSLQETESYIRRWQYKKLWPIQAFLDLKWQNLFTSFKDEFGELDHPDFHSYMSSVWVGPISPKDVEDLKSMEIEELISFLDSWRPSGDPMAPSPEGLGRELTALVSSEPERFSIETKQFEKLDPTYVRALLSGFREALKQQKSFQWTPILDLCRWVIDQPREIPERKGEYMDIDPDWGWTLKTIADLFSVAFELDAIPFDLRTAAWEVLKPITDDPDPTTEHEEQYGGSNMDPATLSINTTRGVAMHTVVYYALWIRRHIEEAPDRNERVARGFEEMPEIREILENHLDPKIDPSLAIRAVYGQWFPWLVILDKRWVDQNITKIFPMDKTLRNLHDAAWVTYIDYCRPYDNVLDLLRGEYNHAIDRIGTFSEYRQLPVKHDEHLVEHLLTYYWRGELNIDDPDGLLARFYMKAPEELRGQAIEFIGRSLYKTKETVEPEILDRLKRLWEKRINVIHTTTPPIITTEFVGFGWWFASAKLDDSWAISQLKDVLELMDDISPDHLVVERLAELSKVMPLLAVECLILIVKSNTKRWRIRHFVKHMQIIIAAALQSTDDSTREVAESLVESLGASGNLDFRNLLSGIDSLGET